jgi:hypothetical protein
MAFKKILPLANQAYILNPYRQSHNEQQRSNSVP